MARDLIISDPKLMLGKPTVAGTRITVELILEKLARNFGHDNQHASERELEEFLNAKAAEFWQIRKRLEKLA